MIKSGLTLGGLRFIIYILAAGTKNTKYPRTSLLAQPALFFEPEPVPRLPGPAVGPEDRKIVPKTEAGVINVQGGFCQQKHNHRNADSKIGPGE